MHAACLRPAEYRAQHRHHCGFPFAKSHSRENIFLLSGCMKCWAAEICMISKLLQIRASTLRRPLIMHERVSFQCCSNRLHRALSNVLMEITNDLLITGMSATLHSYSLES